MTAPTRMFRAAARLTMAGASLLMGAAAISGAEEGERNVKMSPLHFGVVHEFGMFERGYTSKLGREFNDEWMDHFGAFFTQEAVVNDRLALKAGLGGVFMFPKPEIPGEGFGGSQFKAFYVGPTVAEAMYHFGGVEDSKWSLGGGMFPYKYNPDASNLGEYLFRAIPYPSILQTGGLTAIGGDAAVLQGLRGSFRSGGLSADMLLTTETSIPPLFNGSIALIAGYKALDGLIDLGAGVNFRHILPVSPGKTARESRGNTAVKIGGKWYTGETTYYSKQAEFMKSRYDALMANAAVADKKDTVLYAGRHELERIATLLSTETTAGGWAIPNSNDWVDSAGGKPIAEEQHYTSTGIMGMARMSLDFQKLFAYSGSPQDFRLYGEVAVLGFKNYPVFYEKVAERMPMMAGMNLPTWGWLDRFAVQVEYFNSPNLNNTRKIGSDNWNVPLLPGAGDKIFSENSYNDLTAKDNYAWSILLQKRVWSAFNMSAQVARDHHRTFGDLYWYGSRFDPQEITHRGPGLFNFDDASWYWMFQLGWNI